MKFNRDFLKSRLFLFGIVSIVAAVIGSSFPEQIAKDAVAAIIAAVGAVALLLKSLKSVTAPKFKDIIKSPAVWASVLAVLVGLLPVLAPIVPDLDNLVKAILSGNMSLIIQAAIGLFIAVYRIIKPPLAPSA